MVKFLRNNWIHILILIIAVVFLIAAPRVYAHYFVIDGSPLHINDELPTIKLPVKYSVDRVEIYNDQGSIYNLSGWAFPTDKNILLDKYERKIVLFSPNQTYYFSTRTQKRGDVQEAFKTLGIDVRQSGFSTLISKYEIKKGSYCIGIIFRHFTSGQTYYIDTSSVLIRTPNYIKLVKLQSVDLQCPSPYQDNKPVQVNEALPEETKEANQWIDRLDLIGEGVYQLQGWSFLTIDKIISLQDYERQIALVSDSNNFFFPTEVRSREDVQNHFTDLGMDVTLSGFSTMIDSKSLDSGKYCILVIFKHALSGSSYYVNTDRCISQTAEGLSLENNGTANCCQP